MSKRIAAALGAIGLTGLGWAQTIDLNQASEVELDALQGVGPSLTRQVLSERKTAPFKDWDDVTRRVKGIGPHKARSLSAQGVQVQGKPYAGSPAEKQAAPDATGPTPATRR